MSTSLNHIKQPIEKELKEFEIHFKDSMKSKVALLDKIMYYIVQRKGKQLRPIMVFLSAKAAGQITNASFIAASLVELLHTASLVHDDVVDDSNKRRSFFSINALWKNKIAVLVGDYMLSKGLLLCIENDQFNILKIVSKAVKSLSEGELLQIEKARRLDIKEDVYFEIIKQKTASLIAAGCESGAYSGTDNPTIIEMLRQYGENVGIAYQIKDDLFDYSDDDIGKPKGIDIKEKKMTLPLIHALNKASWLERRQIINIIKNDSENMAKVRKVIQFVKDKGGMEYAISKMNEYKDLAISNLNDLPDSPSKQSLIDIVSFVIDRKK